MRISYTTDSAHTEDGSSNADGNFSIPTGDTLPAATPVTIKSNRPFLLTSVILEAVEAGELVLNTPPENIHFEFKKRLSGPPNIFGRVLDHWSLSVTDTRARSTPWKLYATANTPLTSTHDPSHTLPDALIFVDADESVHLLGSEKTLIWSGDASDGTETTTTIQWAQNQGLLMAACNAPFHAGEEYTTPIHWTLEPVSE